MGGKGSREEKRRRYLSGRVCFTGRGFATVGWILFSRGWATLPLSLGRKIGGSPVSTVKSARVGSRETGLFHSLGIVIDTHLTVSSGIQVPRARWVTPHGPRTLRHLSRSLPVFFLPFYRFLILLRNRNVHRIFFFFLNNLAQFS